MSNRTIDPELDLSIERVIRAPRHRVWETWTRPELLGTWWLPAPYVARVDRLDVRPGGAFVTSMSDNGNDFVAHTDGIFLLIDDDRRLVFTNSITSSWHPAAPEPVSITAEILFDEHPEGTHYQAIVRHKNTADRELHERLGFFEGWGVTTEALAALAETER